MKLGSKTFHAIGNLAVRFWAHAFRRMVAKPPPGSELERFHENYSDDRLVPLGPYEHDVLPEFQKCVNCGSCSSVCPVCKPVAAGSYRGPDSITASLSRCLPDLGDARDAVFNCTRCGACADACPMGINIPELILFARRKSFQVKNSPLRTVYAEKLRSFESGDCGAGGAQSEKFNIYKKGAAKTVFFAGCNGRSTGADDTEKILGLLEATGVEFTTIDEKCCGGFNRVVGAGPECGAENLKAFETAGADRIVTGCPHCLETFRNAEPYKKEFAEKGIRALHISELLLELDITIEAFEGEAVWHDPCFLGRLCGIYDAPRRLAEKLGINMKEMSACREKSACCGSVDGTFIIDRKVSEALGERRLRMAEATGAETLLTECPACASAFRGVNDRKIKVNSLAAFIAERYSGASTPDAQPGEDSEKQDENTSGNND